MAIEKIAIRITEEIRIKLEEYIVKNGLHRQKIKCNQLANDIIRVECEPRKHSFLGHGTACQCI